MPIKTMGWCSVLLLVNAVLTSSLVAAGQLNTATVSPLFFVNAKQQLQLEPVASHYQMQVQGRTLKVQLSNRLLVKTALQHNAASLRQFHPAIEKVQQLAKLQQASWWLVTVKDNPPSAVLSFLQQHAQVLAVQPDLLLQRQNAGAEESSKQTRHQQLIPPVKATKTVRLAIIDDGFDLQHPALQSLNIALQYDADLRLADASPKLAQDQHGTQVAALLLHTTRQHGLEPELVLIRQVSSWTSDLLLGFTVARMMQADIVNSSWILPFLPDPLAELLNEWQQQQPYLVFAAGNNAADACSSNAFSALPGALLVAAAQHDGELWPYSNYGPCIDINAPAYFQLTSSANNKTSAFTGTSAATAYVSAMLAVKMASGVYLRPEQLQLWVSPVSGKAAENSDP
ncbi:MAG: S8/S53 family peptidase [Gammaproteobacteria bacterium]|nr:S8/S53 family peptidase [Gammaproteobacteria bacterium]MBU2057781.1 S8/S53 family peptidase [Gammaproteobacteria bacterium]MBU2174439.1 S8/S53 family peptidase [Gammaproteobacteria bacterium]MBU2245805.1 S8/S53 family peptidase [Gammaproteobacteria bacterium]MBU2344379.1 S8/S53 family peptidase [Gammaproteobacteria bacterium]